MTTSHAVHEIQALVYRYARGVRAKDPASMGVLFTDDAIFEVRTADPASDTRRSLISLSGRSAIVDYLRQSAEQRDWTCPLVHNLIIDLEVDHASSDCVMVGANRAGTPVFMGFYEDRYRLDGSWKFIARTFTVLGGAI